MVVSVVLGILLFSGGTLALRVAVAIVAMLLASIRYIFISLGLIVLLSLLWE